MASNLTAQVRSISEVTNAVAQGNLVKVVDVNVQGEMLDLKLIIDSMVSQLNTLTNKVTGESFWISTAQISNLKGPGYG
ncbi:hypothetical protein H0H92_008291 [Tricholoma furcatifolium]|nr:hypothetical protein H0H92_008291 [Tricholoma furcatifolium]